MGAMTSQITSLTILYSTVYSGTDQGKHQSSASLAFERAIHRSPLISPHKWPVTRKMFPFDEVTILRRQSQCGAIMHVCLNEFIIGSCNRSLLIRCQTITSTNGDAMSNWSFQTRISDISIEIKDFHGNAPKKVKVQLYSQENPAIKISCRDRWSLVRC